MSINAVTILQQLLLSLESLTGLDAEAELSHEWHIPGLGVTGAERWYGVHKESRCDEGMSGDNARGAAG